MISSTLLPLLGKFIKNRNHTRMETCVKEFTITGPDVVKDKSGNVYRRLGLDVTYGHESVTVKSTEQSFIRSVGEITHVHTYAMCSLEGDDGEVNSTSQYEHSQHSMPLEMMDDFGNKVLVTFMPRNVIQNIAIITSGGDAPGMNPVIRSVLRTGMRWGINVYGIYRGYEGLISENIELLDWNFANTIVDDGGTILLSSRSERFQTKEGRREAAYHLAKRNIECLIVVGGDGSIKGATILLNEFGEHMADLVREGRLPDIAREPLRVIGIPASIDNDIPYADMTLGADSALHRVIECVDHIISTMVSHQRIFVIEVMGRHCGWIALMSSFATGADYVMLPEVPAQDWQSDMIEEIKRSRTRGKKGIFVIVSEGAVDRANKIIDSKEVVDFIIKSTQAEVKLLKLGHLQRGGPPSAYDKITGTMLGIKALERLLCSKDVEPSLVCVSDGEYRFVSLKKVFEADNLIKKYQAEGNFNKVLEMRGSFFQRAFLLNEQLINQRLTASTTKKIGILHSGKRAGGMNSALHAVVRYCLSLGQEIHVVQDGFDGLIDGRISKASEYDYVTSINSGGSAIGLGRPGLSNVAAIYNKVKEHKFDGLIMVGGTDALLVLSRLKKCFSNNNERINIVLIPATASNNIPGTETCVGSDTALNSIVRASETLRLSSTSIKNSVFVLDVQGGNCGYLATLGGIAAGAFDTFIPERKYMINHLSSTARRIKQRFAGSPRNGLLLIRNRKTFAAVGTDAFARLLETDSENNFTARSCFMGHLQEGANPSPLDRINSTLLGMKAVDIVLERDRDSIVSVGNEVYFGLIGINGRSIMFTDVDECLKNFDRKKKREKNPKWLAYDNICKYIE